MCILLSVLTYICFFVCVCVCVCVRVMLYKKVIIIKRCHSQCLQISVKSAQQQAHRHTPRLNLHTDTHPDSPCMQLTNRHTTTTRIRELLQVFYLRTRETEETLIRKFRITNKYKNSSSSSSSSSSSRFSLGSGSLSWGRGKVMR